MNTVQLARHAMATRFEIVAHGDDPVRLRAAGEEALDEIERLEAQLSLYRPSSEIARVNARAAGEPVRVSPSVFRLLQHARQLAAETRGAFDITIAPLVRCWGFMGGAGELPAPGAVQEARTCVGMHLVEFDEAKFTVHFAREGVMLDLGAIGKGYAVAAATGILRDAGVTSALIHGGTSSIYALGHPPDGDAWKIAIPRPQIAPQDQPSTLAVAALRDEALSVSAIWGKSFQAGGNTFGHVLDPRTGEPVSNTLLAAVILPDATETDALSTALLTADCVDYDALVALRPSLRTLVVRRAPDAPVLVSTGDWQLGFGDFEPDQALPDSCR